MANGRFLFWVELYVLCKTSLINQLSIMDFSVFGGMNMSKYFSSGVALVRRLALQMINRYEKGRVKLRGIFPRSRASYARCQKADDTLLIRANELWEGGRRDFALKTVNAALLKNSKDALLWFWLFEKYEVLEESAASTLCLRNAVDLDPGNVKAISILIDKSGERHWTGEVTRAYKRLTREIERKPELARDALSLFIPSKYAPGLQLLSKSSDLVVQGTLKLSKGEDISDLGLSSEDAQLAELFDHLLHGRQSKTINLIHETPEDQVPLNAIYVTARRYLRKGKRDLANALLTELVRRDLSDSWARRQLEKMTKSQLSNYQLAKVGFPFSPRSKKPLIETNSNRALYLLHNSLPYHSAGYATRTHGLLKSVRDFGWDVQGVTRLGYPFDMPKFEEFESIDALETVDGVPYRRLSLEPGIEKKAPIQEYVGRYSVELEKLVRQEQPFLIHAASNHWNGLTAVETANRLGIPSIYEVRGLWEVTRGSRDPEWAQGGMYKFMARMEADAAKGATRVLAITNALKDELVDRGVDEAKIIVLPNGVDTDRFVPRQCDEDLKRSLNLMGKTIIGYVGSVLDYEGLGLLIDAAKILRQRGKEFAVLIVGDGAELDRFKHEVVDAELDDVFVFTGRVPHDEVENYYSIIDITPFPRLPLPVCEMVSPLKPFEAMAMQKAVVASSVKALAEIVRDGENGLLHEKGSAQSLADKLATLLDNPELRESIAQNGRDWVVSERQWKDLGRIVSDLYLELGGGLIPNSDPFFK